jgi:ribokinase
MSQPRAPVTVLGSINMDIVLRVARFPKPGETILATTITRRGGGKGANQAIAAARAGAAVRMIGAIGGDADGRHLLSLLQENGVDCAQVEVDPENVTGAAYVVVDGEGENQIIVFSGSNATAADGDEDREGVLLAQLEVPLPSVSSFLARRGEASVTILNAAPFRQGAEELFGLADLVVINETELATYCDAPDRPARANEVVDMARTLLRRDGQRIIVTRGAMGSITVKRDAVFAAPSAPADVVDSTGAGDCFCGFVAAELAAGRALSDAITTAHRAAALAVSNLGASSSIPTMSEVIRHFREN